MIVMTPHTTPLLTLNIDGTLKPFGALKKSAYRPKKDAGRLLPKFPARPAQREACPVLQRQDPKLDFVSVAVAP
ncbi:protein of unknown function [Candidatus Hydrogenisulfobacillus filiaventi]|uniref:Uncharacterized protein n=1 Tax=Candidatus Hydrogenisulfobacillus filiaventi TaxID=2707344 RepID=A0A6F8ZDC5_9FIRM|nr:protein of unknown function [Candidatus Hydrogenisulfobacillus filiaventi]